MNEVNGLQMSVGQVFVAGSLVVGRGTEKDTTAAPSLTIAPACVATHLSEPITDFTTAVVPTTTGVFPRHDGELSRTETSFDPKVPYQPVAAGNSSRLTDGILDGCVSGTIESIVSWMIDNPAKCISAFSGTVLLLWSLCSTPVTLPLTFVVLPYLLAIPTVWTLGKKTTKSIQRKLKQPTSV